MSEALTLNRDKIGRMPRSHQAVDPGQDRNTFKSGEATDPVSKKVFTTDERPTRADVPVSKFRLPRFSKAFNQYFEKAKREGIKLEQDPAMGHRKTYPEVNKTTAGDYETDRHNEAYFEKLTDTVAGARKAIEMARDLEEQQASELFLMIEKKHPQILLNRRRF